MMIFRAALLLASSITVLLLSSPIVVAADTSPQHIRTLITQTYDTPSEKSLVEPIVIVKNFAIADWLQGERGGRALLRKSENGWHIVLCAGDGLRTEKGLLDAGVPLVVARQLARNLVLAEQSLPPNLVKKFGIFGTTDDPRFQLDRPHHSH